MSDPRHTDPLRRLNLQGAVARTNAAGPTWTTVWTWLAAIAATIVILGLVFGYSRSDLVRDQSTDPATTGSAAESAPSAPLAVPRQGDERAPEPPTPAGDEQ